MKRWWGIPTGLAILGVLFGALAGASIRPSAEALVSVSSRSSMDASTMARVMETTVQQVRAPAVFERAATALGDSVGSDGLRDRTRISVVATSQVLAIHVVAATPEDAIRQTDAVVHAALTEQQAARLVALARVTQSVRGLMQSADSKVQDKDAEQARLIRLGAALADSQSTVVTGEVNLEPLQSARSAMLSAGASTLALFCGLGGGLLGVAIALLLGVRRGRELKISEQQFRLITDELHLALDERAAAVERAEAARRVAEEASQLKDEFLATASHELRTPLNAIVGWVHVLQTGALDDDEQRQKAVNAIDRNAKIQTRLIEDLLDVSRMIQGRVSLTVAPVDLRAIVDAAVETLRPAAAAKGIDG